MLGILECFENYFPNLDASAKKELQELQRLIGKEKEGELNLSLLQALSTKPYWRSALAYSLDLNPDFAEGLRLTKSCERKDAFFTHFLKDFVIDPDEWPSFRLLPLDQMKSFDIFLGMFWFREMIRENITVEDKRLFRQHSCKHYNFHAIFDSNQELLGLINEAVSVDKESLELLQANLNSLCEYYATPGYLASSYHKQILGNIFFARELYDDAARYYNDSLTDFYWAFYYLDSSHNEINNVCFTSDLISGEKKMLSIFPGFSSWEEIKEFLLAKFQLLEMRHRCDSPDEIKMAVESRFNNMPMIKGF